MSQSTAAPVRQRDRIQIIDTIRGIALLGILLMNIPYFSNPEVYAFNLNGRNEYTGPNYYTWWIVEGLFSGSMRGLFSLLFGAGVILLLERLEKGSNATAAADIYYRRLLWLFLFGLIDAFIFIWPGDVLYAYALCGLFLFPFRRMKARGLFFMAMLFLVLATTKATYRFHTLRTMRIEGEKALALQNGGTKLGEESAEALKKWQGYLEKRKPENIRKEADKEIRQVAGSGYFGVMSFFSGINAQIQSKFFYHFGFWDFMLCLFLGMALFKWKILSGGRSLKFYMLLFICCYPIGLLISWWEHSTFISLKFDGSRYLDHLYIMPLQVRRLCITLAYLSLVMILYKAGVAKRLWLWLSRVGQMAFTNYLMQSLICGTIFYGYGFALFGKLQRHQEYYVVAGVWVFQLIFSNLWLRYYRFGPFEWVWRSLTYWKQQPMRKRQRQEEEARQFESVSPVLSS
jgi:uncharacterized protein